MAGRKRPGIWRKWADRFLAVLFLAALAFVVARQDRTGTTSFSGTPVVIDGDTVRFGKERLRLRGIDAPELSQSCTRAGKAYACGREARAALARHAYSGKFSCEGWERDRYGRLLVACRDGNDDVNRTMVLSGWAVSYGDYRVEELSARDHRKGLWDGEFQRPREWRAIHGDAGDGEHDVLARIGNWLRQIVFDARPDAGP
ncbi:MAG: thermonuclease family protein [Brucellaceae bacterium]|nr:thermonuclease family protein [Brucellaceae bacterium]